MPDECLYCIYNPCGKTGNEITYCFVRILILGAKQRRKEQKSKNENRKC